MAETQVCRIIGRTSLRYSASNEIMHQKGVNIAFLIALCHSGILSLGWNELKFSHRWLLFSDAEIASDTTNSSQVWPLATGWQLEMLYSDFAFCLGWNKTQIATQCLNNISEQGNSQEPLRKLGPASIFKQHSDGNVSWWTRVFCRWHVFSSKLTLTKITSQNERF